MSNASKIYESPHADYLNSLDAKLALMEAPGFDDDADYFDQPALDEIAAERKAKADKFRAFVKAAHEFVAQHSSFTRIID